MGWDCRLLGGSLGVLIVALAPGIPMVLVGWCIAQVFLNALLAALVAVLPDHVPPTQRGLVSGVLGACVPIASVAGTVLVTLFTGDLLAMFMVPCAVGGFFILLFAATLNDRRLTTADKPAWSLRELADTFYVVFVPAASTVYGVAMFVIALASDSTASWSAWPSAASASASTSP